MKLKLFYLLEKTMEFENKYWTKINSIDGFNIAMIPFLALIEKSNRKMVLYKQNF